MSTTLAIDFGSRNIGVTLLAHSARIANDVLYAGTIVVDSKPLNAAVQDRAERRRIRRTRKTHRRRLRRLAQALRGVPNVERIVRFCRRRGFSHDPEEAGQDERALQLPREDFFAALRAEVERIVPAEERERVLRACAKHLNESRRRSAELRPARFDNRGPSKCQWRGCHRNVARADNDARGRLQQTLYVWLKPIFDASKRPDQLRRSVDHWIGELDALARRYRKTRKLEEPKSHDERKRIDRRKNQVFKNIRDRVRAECDEDVADEFAENWAKVYCRNLTDIVHGEQAGRVRYCREHSSQFVDFFLAGRQIPNRTEVLESDLFGRTQQIVFRRLWRFVESRLLPLAGGHIDEVVVERVAFDVLAGKARARRETSEDRAAEMYWYGPQYGFASRREMLKKEFDGRCAYCGQQGASVEVEHLLPRSEFPFDSYFNVLPACNACNAQKGARTAFAARMAVHEDAYRAYSEYVSRLKTPHLFHTIKKGMLNLLRRESNSVDVERQLGMLADNLVTITNTQKGPRPLARFLASRLTAKSKKPCEARWTSGRHTALYRSILMPEYCKEQEKEDGDLTNHAIDAVILGCELPSAAAMENPRWRASAKDLVAWREKVRANGPALRDGLPAVEAVELVPYFERHLQGGYCTVDLSAFNWNRSRQSGYRVDPVGWTTAGQPIKREPAVEVLANLKDAAARADQIRRIANTGLRTALQANPEKAAEHFVQWLQQTVAAGVAARAMGPHPSDQARKRLLDEFAHANPADFLLAKGGRDIPKVIGIRCLNAGAAGVFDVSRCDSDGRIYQRYKADPRYRAVYVGYCERKGQLDRARPVVFWVNQTYTVTQQGRSELTEQLPGDSPLRGRPLGSSGSLRDFLATWQDAFDELCREAGIVKRFQIMQGCVIEKINGNVFQLRNFARDKPWMKGMPFRNIRRVYRSPLRFLQMAKVSAEGASSTPTTS